MWIFKWLKLTLFCYKKVFFANITTIKIKKSLMLTVHFPNVQFPFIFNYSYYKYVFTGGYIQLSL